MDVADSSSRARLLLAESVPPPRPAPPFFGTLNTAPRTRAATARAFGRVPFLNGGLFSRTPLERRCRDLTFTDDSLGGVFGHLLTRYRFTPREESTRWSEAAVDPEMLGRALIAHGERRAGQQGAYSRQCRSSPASPERDPRRSRTPSHAVWGAGRRRSGAAAAAIIHQRSAELQVVTRPADPVHSHVHILEELAALQRRLGDPRSTAEVRRVLLARAIFGVDVNPTAVWLCELRLWLSVVIESPESDPMAVPPLPNLDHQVRVGDALAGDAFDAPSAGGASLRLSRLRARYARATGARKRSLERALDRAERALAQTRVSRALQASSARRRDLLTPRPFARPLRRAATASAGITTGRDAAERLRSRDLRATVAAHGAREQRSSAGPRTSPTSPHEAASMSRSGIRLGSVCIGFPPWLANRTVCGLPASATRPGNKAPRRCMLLRGSPPRLTSPHSSSSERSPSSAPLARWACSCRQKGTRSPAAGLAPCCSDARRFARSRTGRAPRRRSTPPSTRAS
jgi:hypothetical protein